MTRLEALYLLSRKLDMSMEDVADCVCALMAPERAKEHIAPERYVLPITCGFSITKVEK